MRFARRKIAQISLLVFVLSHVAFGLHAAKHVAGDAIDCVSCSTHAHAPVAISSEPFEIQVAPGTAIACDLPETRAPRDTFQPFNSRGPPQLS